MTKTEIWLYGSVARGTADDGSDVDILIVTDETGPVDVPDGEHVSVRTYGWSAVEQMAAYGSLFLLHLKREGRPLTTPEPSRLRELLVDLPPYQRTADDIEGFRIGLADARESLLDGGSADFELSVIATVVRHCSILACYLLGTPLFDRTTSIRTAFRATGLARDADGAVDLYRFRLAEARGIAAPIAADVGVGMHWAAIADKFVCRVGDLAPAIRGGIT
ncbi:nucleotidyltransferase domain-containing protein [Kribbella sp. NPDC049584]|uniref:nucleotidyltransferase domain-containing protein n=1 Tax=Kribbella sp. NPDC049584 TaxID=3154833 RepID=UPI00341F3AB6